jgi:hypothetical protein
LTGLYGFDLHHIFLPALLELPNLANQRELLLNHGQLLDNVALHLAVDTLNAAAITVVHLHSIGSCLKLFFDI